jgi:heptosyltransferase I
MTLKNKLATGSAPKKICILRLSALGDITHVIPVVRAIQAQWPETEITWICGKIEYQLLKLINGVNFQVFDKKKGVSAYYELWKSLTAQRFDILLHMQVAARANIASWLIKADIKIGWDKNRSRDLHWLFINKCVAAEHQQHQLQGFLSFARRLRLPAKKPDWKIPISASAETFAAKHINKDKRVLVISACSSHKLRNWPAERYAQLADYAIDNYDMQVILSGGPADIEINTAAEIIANMHNQATNLVAMDTLEELVGLLSKADVVVSPDSGPAHIANAVGVPVIGLYACTWSKRSGPYNSLQFCVDRFDMAADIFLNKSVDTLPWGTKIEKPGVMELIEVDDVCKRLDQVMKVKGY